MVIRNDIARNVLVVTKGHPFDRGAFFAMLDALPGQGEQYTWTHVEHPAATALFRPDEAWRFSAFLLYDMPGIAFRVPEPPIFEPPPAGFMDNLERLLDGGMPFLFLHHAIAGWPTSDRYADIMGARFLYQPANLHGRACADSGYRHDVTHHVMPVAQHPVTEGLSDGFTITDELYLAEIFEDNVQPLMRSNHAFVDDEFYSAGRAMEGQLYSRDGWTHKPGSNLIAWARQEKASRIVTVQCGDGPAAYANAGYRTLLGNALAWLMAIDPVRPITKAND
jgi:hypothetical protein